MRNGGSVRCPRRPPPDKRKSELRNLHGSPRPVRLKAALMGPNGLGKFRVPVGVFGETIAYFSL